MARSYRGFFFSPFRFHFSASANPIFSQHAPNYFFCNCIPVRASHCIFYICVCVATTLFGVPVLESLSSR